MADGLREQRCFAFQVAIDYRKEHTLDIRVVVGDVTKFRGDALVVNLFEGVKSPGGATGAVDGALSGAIRKMMQAGEGTRGGGGQTLGHTLGGGAVRRA